MNGNLKLPVGIDDFIAGMMKRCVRMEERISLLMELLFVGRDARLCARKCNTNKGKLMLF